MKNDSHFNNLFADYRALTPDQRSARLEQIIRQAKSDRDRAVRAAFVTLFAWLRNTIARAWTAVLAGKHPVYPRRGVRGC